jgi:transcriptional regulator with XRE-family HTH domain
MDLVVSSSAMVDILGNTFPICQGTLSPANGKEFPMAEKRPLPRAVLAKNLKALIDKSGMSAPEVAKRAGIDRKTVNNQLNGRYDPRPEQVDAVAKVFGLTGWLLLSSSFRPEMADNGNIGKLLELYADANKHGKENILRVAEMEARYKS